MTILLFTVIIISIYFRYAYTNNGWGRNNKKKMSGWKVEEKPQLRQKPFFYSSISLATFPTDIASLGYFSTTPLTMKQEETRKEQKPCWGGVSNM